MRLLTLKNLQYIATAVVEAYAFNLAIWYVIRGSFNQETDVIIFLGSMVVYFLIPVFLSNLLKKYEILWKKVLSFSILSGIISAILILFYSVSCVSGMFYFDSLSTMSSFWERFWIVSFLFLFLIGVVHFFIGFWSLAAFLLRPSTYQKEKQTVESEIEVSIGNDEEPLQYYSNIQE